MTLTDTIFDRALQSGWSDAAAVRMALDPTINSLADLEAAITVADDVRALCRIAKLANYPADELADAFVQARTPLPEVRFMLCESRAEADEALHIDTAPRLNSAMNAACIWEKRTQEADE